MPKFGPFSGHFDLLARIWVLARNFGSNGSSGVQVTGGKGDKFFHVRLERKS